MKGLSKDAKNFVEGVVGYLEHGKKSSSGIIKVEGLLRKVSRRARDESQAQVESSVDLTKNEKENISRLLAEFLGHSATLNCSINRGLIAGLRIRVADWIVDTSFDTQLKELAKSLI